MDYLNLVSSFSGKTIRLPAILTPANEQINQFKVSKINVDVLRGWEEHAVVGLIGMDILSKMTFILSHEHKKFILSSQTLPELDTLFNKMPTI